MSKFQENRSRFEKVMRDLGIFMDATRGATLLSEATLTDLVEDELDRLDLWAHVASYGRPKPDRFVVQWIENPQTWEELHLDCMSTEELRAFYQDYKNPSDILLARFFKNCGLAKQKRKKVLQDLVSYADNKSQAQAHRLGGNISRALTFENACDQIYRRVLSEIRW